MLANIADAPLHLICGTLLLSLAVDTNPIADHNARMSQALLDYMEEHDVTQPQIARRLNRVNSYVWGRLNNRHHLSSDIVVAAALISGIEPEQLWAELAVRAARMSSRPQADTAPSPEPESGSTGGANRTQ